MTSEWSFASRLILLVGITALGALGGLAIGMPVPLLTGPALLTTIGCLAGLPLVFPLPLRNAIFLLAGVAIGATVSPESMAALLRWPLAFAVLGMAIVLMVFLGQRLMRRMMRVDDRSALLAAAPGHLSYVIALGEDLGLDTRRVAVVQSIRLLALTLLVPFLATLSGMETGLGLGPGGAEAAEMTMVQTAIAVLAAVALAPLVKLTGAPAPMLLAGMAVGAAMRLSGWAPGGLSHYIAFPVLAAIGALIGTRFAGISLTELRQSLLAGLAVTTLAAVLTLIAAWLATYLVGMPLAHVLVAFAPGGLETMAVMGAAIGANPGFVAAAHVGRLVLLSILVPVLVARNQGPLPLRD
ncbi:AbrB family transcriptional regulator [Cognatiyoonia sp. IB215446]|uniref:AbrB family transcriptional regulator n=1 Tax=Cognatiyoonia sp. IB215446 TaxID=3097355 RepID=UPI002A170064|nr:AbrB family transcriptional regulator [Cognatiyoonia sp. IB215446]MDX8347042.1 AbrB family transcriptional regulator [Cognatiyoonia sp. IB215446]